MSSTPLTGNVQQLTCVNVAPFLSVSPSPPSLPPFIPPLLFSPCPSPCVTGQSDLAVQTISSVEEMSSSGSGVKGKFLGEATIAKQIELSDCIGRGRYGEVWRGVWYDKEVAVKKFADRDRESWQREKDIYETSLLRHDYILSYLAVDRHELGEWG